MPHSGICGDRGTPRFVPLADQASFYAGPCVRLRLYFLLKKSSTGFFTSRKVIVYCNAMPDTTHRFTKQILKMLGDGVEFKKIYKELGCTPAAVRYHAVRMGRQTRGPKLPRYDWDEIQKLHDSGMTRKELMLQFGFSEPAWTFARRRGDIKPNSLVIPIEQFLQKDTKFDRANMRRRLLNSGLMREECYKCGVLEWMGAKLRTQIHHKNGNNTDNRLDNLEMLCPNCHSLTDTYMGRNSTKAILKKKSLGLPHPRMDRIANRPELKLNPWVKPPVIALGRKAPRHPLHGRDQLQIPTAAKAFKRYKNSPQPVD